MFIVQRARADQELNDPATGWQYGNGRILLRNLNRNYQPEKIKDTRSL